MSARKRIGVFYSRGRQFGRILEAVRRDYPEAELVAVVPAGYPFPGDERGLCDGVVETGCEPYGIRHPMPLVRLIRLLRAQRFDPFIILFDSPRLRLLAALVGTPHTLYCAFDHALKPIHSTIAGVLADVAARGIVGRAVYGALWLAVRVRRVHRDPR